MPTLFESKDFQSIQPYLPEDARKVLDAELPKIREQAIKQIDEFAESLVTELTRQLKELADRDVAELKTAQDKLKGDLAAFIKANPTDPLSQGASALKAAVEEHEKRFCRAGEALRQTVVTTLQAHGLPVGQIGEVVKKLNEAAKLTKPA